MRILTVRIAIARDLFTGAWRHPGSVCAVWSSICGVSHLKSSGKAVMMMRDLRVIVSLLHNCVSSLCYYRRAGFAYQGGFTAECRIDCYWSWIRHSSEPYLHVCAYIHQYVICFPCGTSQVSDIRVYAPDTSFVLCLLAMWYCCLLYCA